jgi:competence protein ComEC
MEIQSTEKGFKYKISLNEHHDIDVWFFNKNQLFCEIGDTISGVGEFQEIAAVRNPGEFDFMNYYNRQNLYGWIFADDHYVIHIDKNDAFQINKFIGAVRDKIRNYFNKYASGVAGNLLSALILGDKSDIEPSIRDSFAETGVIHVLAVSGLHVSYVLIILLLLKNMLRLPWGWDRIIVILGLCIFVIITGSKASVVRASIMAGLYILAPVVNRQVKIWNIIAAAGFIILCFSPFDLFDLGFQLSFLAVISIVFFYNWLNETLPEKIRVNNIQNSSVRFIWGLFLVSFAAQIGTIPLTSFVFGKIPVIALIANVFIVPLIGLLVGIGFAILFLSWIPGIGIALGNTAWLIAKIITSMTYYFSNLKYSSIQLTFSPFTYCYIL